LDPIAPTPVQSAEEHENFEAPRDHFFIAAWITLVIAAFRGLR
jgi:hypothetical protein